MIVGDIKPFEELAATLSGFREVLVLGCGGCVTVCRAGGEAEALDVARELSHPRWYAPGSAPPTFRIATIERQCENDLLGTFLEVPAGTEAVLSLACGVGVQILADVLEPMPILPALSTTFMGGADEPGEWREKCKGCGDCLLASTGGVCPIALCAKSLANGPCGGSQNGHCELGEDIPCAWVRIYQRLELQDRLDLLDEVRPTRDWRKAGFRGPRRRSRPGVALR